MEVQYGESLFKQRRLCKTIFSLYPRIGSNGWFHRKFVRWDWIMKVVGPLISCWLWPLWRRISCRMGLSIPMHSPIHHPKRGALLSIPPQGVDYGKTDAHVSFNYWQNMPPSYVKDYQSPCTVFGAIDNESITENFWTKSWFIFNGVFFFFKSFLFTEPKSDLFWVFFNHIVFNASFFFSFFLTKQLEMDFLGSLDYFPQFRGKCKVETSVITQLPSMQEV